MLGAVPSVPTDLLACPVCRDVVTEGPGRVTCASCGRRYSVDDGVPDFLLSPPVDGLDAAPGPIGRSLGAIVGIPPVYDLVQRLAGVEETLTRVGRKLEQAAGALVLDIGGGTGRIEAVLPAAARYLWLDADRQKLRGFRTKSASPAILGDATRLPLMDRSLALRPRETPARRRRLET